MSSPHLDKIKNILISMRPEQWLKNAVVFAGIIFARKLFDFYTFLSVVATFAVFCLMSGAIYIFNDLCDRKYDKEHPFKIKRPIAAGRLKVKDALLSMVLLFTLSFAGAFVLNSNFGLICIVYSLIHIAYSLILKRIVIIDVITVASGYVLRALAGTTIVKIEASNWFIVCIFLLALFMAISKRRAEFVLKGLRAAETRSVLKAYGLKFLDQMISVVCAATIIAYCLYTISEETVKRLDTVNMKYTIPFVVYGIFRYLLLIYKKKDQPERPERAIILDRPLVLAIICWSFSVLVILYFK